MLGRRRRRRANIGAKYRVSWDCGVVPICQRIFNPFKSEFTIVILIQYKTRIAVAILDL